MDVALRARLLMMQWKTGDAPFDVQFRALVRELDMDAPTVDTTLARMEADAKLRFEQAKLEVEALAILGTYWPAYRAHGTSSGDGRGED